MKFLRLKMLSLMSVLAFLTACDPQGPQSADDYDIVITNVSPDADFENKMTFGMPWKVIHVGDTTESELTEMDLVILNTVKEEMLAKNWEFIEENDSRKPDVVALCYSVTTTTIYTWWNWWGGYPGWGWGPGWGYPWYPYPIQGVSAYQKGTITVELADNVPTQLPATLSEDDSVAIPILWEGLTNGFTTNDKDEQRRAEKNIRQMFEQSPYLNK
ncbi:DUF4136 domain-containing protein [Flammeovirga sp. SJP92]|uniref:DUF4136 domain-containing protein n=1 Tax=Flammeovirga sp. SJP92 TaxID=1775430 RepID=UPI000788CF2C|nr:DUF4136 domain-containing protein [Flammeovirga sp. SJP92]KXX66950.1 hypothetical protein AVL50_28615 [Flammeovirga sp. SJP92]